MTIKERSIPHIFRNKYLRDQATSIKTSSISSGGVSVAGRYLPATLSENGYIVPHYVTFQANGTDEEGNEVIKNLLEITSNGIKVNGNIVATGEVTAYGSGESGGSTVVGNVTIYDGLDSTDPTVALSANQGRILKELIGEGGVETLEKLQDTELTDLQDGQILVYNAEKGLWLNSTANIKADDYLLKSVWDSVFTVNDNGDLKVKVNVIGEKEISAWGAGTSSGTGAITIIDGLTSTATDAALSANQGRILKELIESQSGGDVDLSNYYTKSQVDDLIEDVDPSWSNISGKPNFATVATSGSYSDLSNKPSLATVATSGKYSDLTGKPTIPDVSKYLPLSGGTMTGSIITPADDDLGIIPATNNYGQIGSSSKKFYRMYASTFYGDLEGNVSWSNITNKPTSMPASDVYSWAKASSKPSYSWSEITSKPTIPTNNNQLTNGAGYITSSGSISGNAATATKLATSRTLWGQSFNGSANVSGNMTGVGSISCTSVSASGEVTAHSDKRLKSNIKPLEVRGELNPVTYVKDGKESIGFIADEVKEVYPELVITDESTDEKYLSLNYAQLTAVLYAEIKELKNQIKELNEKVRTMAN